MGGILDKESIPLPDFSTMSRALFSICNEKSTPLRVQQAKKKEHEELKQKIKLQNLEIEKQHLEIERQHLEIQQQDAEIQQLRAKIQNQETKIPSPVIVKQMEELKMTETEPVTRTFVGNTIKCETKKRKRHPTNEYQRKQRKLFQKQ